MSENPKQIIDRVRRMLVTNILTGPKPLPDEMALLSPEYQAVWRVDREIPVSTSRSDATAVSDRWFDRPGTTAEYASDQETQRLFRLKRQVESEQLASLATVEKLLSDNERWRQGVSKHIRTLEEQLEKCRVESREATTTAEAAAVQRRIRQCRRLRQASLSKLAEVRRAEEKVLRATRHTALKYVGMVKNLEARKDYRQLLHKEERAARGGLGLLATIGAILLINDFQTMADGISKLANQK